MFLKIRKILYKGTQKLSKERIFNQGPSIISGCLKETELSRLSAKQGGDISNSPSGPFRSQISLRTCNIKSWILLSSVLRNRLQFLHEIVIVFDNSRRLELWFQTIWRRYKRPYAGTGSWGVRKLQENSQIKSKYQCHPVSLMNSNYNNIIQQNIQ